jgi:hypothetical protein
MRKDSKAFNRYIYYSHWPKGQQSMKIIFKFDCKNFFKKIFNKNGPFSSRYAPMRQ